MYFVFVILEQLSFKALKEIASDNGVILSHYDELNGPIKLLMGDDEKGMLDAVDDILGDAVLTPHLIEGAPFWITA